jgi:UDP-3-O-acyl-N-acetylglucosamine deacetylase
MQYTRRTTKSTLTFEGKGLHSGVPVKVTVTPSDSGIRFYFGDRFWQALPENVTDTTRCTRLGEISTVEHLMSAFAGAEITDATVEVDAPEMPALDGSSNIYFKALIEGGLEDLGTEEAPAIFSRTFVQDGDAKIAVSAGEGHWRYEFHTGERWPGCQTYESTDIVVDYAGVSTARTFAFQEELPMIQAAGLGQGLDSDSALILGTDGYLNTERCSDEPVRHKILDAIGDIYLAGIPIRMLNVVAVRTGHTMNVKAAHLLREQLRSVVNT